MKRGVRALGVAESYRTDSSTLAGVVTRADRVVDGLAFGSCTVGGTDATGSILALYGRLGREDVQYLLVAGIAPAWYNLIDIHELFAETGLPVISVSFEESEGLEPAIEEAFDGEAATRRLETYRALPDREQLAVPDGELFFRAVGLSAAEAEEVVREFTPEGGRPEPLRLARLAARAVDQYEDG